jgi:hypothetical protein
LKRCVARAVRAFDGCFDGEIDRRVYIWLRIGFASLLLLRSTDFTRSIWLLDHHHTVNGFDFSWSIEQAPYLVSPLIPGLVLGARATWWAVRARVALALVLLLGIRPRWTAAALTLLNYGLLFADRYRYFHHLHLLYLGVAWLALVPERSADGQNRALLPAWPLQILRSLLVGIYVAAGSAKLSASWWSGDSLAILSHLQQVRGSIWRASTAIVGIAGVAKLVCATELLLPALLVIRATRRVGVLLGVAFHVLVSSVMPVSIFGATMTLLLSSFWPPRRRVG